MAEHKFKNALSRNKYSFLAFFASVFVMIVVYFCFEVIPFGDYTVLRMDLYHQYGPLFAELYDRITQGKSLIYSWNSGLGSSFLGNFANYLSSPGLFFMLLVGHKNMPEAISLMVLFKAAFASFFFSYYLRKSTGRDGFSISAFGVLYSFCGFFIAYYWNVMWIDAMAIFPLVIYGIESIITKGKTKLYIFSLAAVMLTNYYMAYIICLFSVIYFIFFYFSRYGIGDKLTQTEFIDENGQELIVSKKTAAQYKNRTYIFNSRFLNAGARFAISSIAAGGLAAVMLVPLYFILQSCSATSGTFPSDLKTYFNIFDFIANHLVSLEPTIRSSGEDVLPNVYCGVATAMLAPLYLYSKHYTKQEKGCYILMLGILFASFYTNYANYIWHGFHFPNDLPYRFSYIYSFILLVMAFKAFSHLEDYKPRTLMTVGISALAFLIIAQKVGSKNVTEDTVTIALLFIVLYTFVFILISGDKYKNSAVAMLMFCCVVAEASVGNTSHYVMQQQKKYFVDDYDDFQALKADIDKREKSKFYRMDLTDLRARMDPSWYNYNGLSVFSSMAYENTSNLMSYLGMDGNFINSYSSNGYQTPLFYMMTSLKYIVDNSDGTPVMNPDIYKKSAARDKFKAYRFDYDMNIAYCVNKDVLDWTYSYSNPFDVQNEYYSLATGIEDLFIPLEIDDIEYENIDEVNYGYETGNLTLNKTQPGSSGSVTLNYEIEEDGDYFIFIESSDVEDVTISYSDVVYTHNFDSEHLIGIGSVEEGETVYVTIPIEDADSTQADVYFCRMDFEKFCQGYEILKQGEMSYELFDETHIMGKVTADEDCLLYTSIPYDESWNIFVDGERVNTAQMRANKIGDGLIGCKLKKGAHSIEFRYVPKGGKAGLLITAVTILALIAVFILLKKKKPFKAFTEGYEEKTLTNKVTLQYNIIDPDEYYGDDSVADNEIVEYPNEGQGFELEEEALTEAEGSAEAAVSIEITEKPDLVVPASSADQEIPSDISASTTERSNEVSETDL